MVDNFCLKCKRVFDLCDCPSVVEKQLKEWADHWERDDCVKCGKEFLFFKGNLFRRCGECEKEGMNVSVDEYQDLLAKHTKVLEMLRVAEEALHSLGSYQYSLGMGHRYVELIRQHCAEALDEIERMKK